MVKDKIPDYYDQLIRALIDEYGEDGFSHTRTYDNSPSKFPHVYMKRLDSPDIMQTQNGVIHGIDNTVEISAYHNKGITEAEEFADKVRTIMTSTEYGIGLKCRFFNQIDNAADSSIIRFVMRFEGKTTELE